MKYGNDPALLPASATECVPIELRLRKNALQRR